MPVFGAVGCRSALAVAVASLLLAGCSSGSATPAPPATTGAAASGTGTVASPTATAGDGGAAATDACTMLSLDQVSAALGQPAAAGKQDKIFDTSECQWQPASGANGTVTLDVGPWDGDPGIKPLRTGAAVAGVGDEAFDSGNTGLYVRKGTSGLRIWVFNVGSGTRLDLEKQLAAVVLAEL